MMKYIRIIRAWFRGIRFQMLLLSGMMAFSLFLAVGAISKYEYLRTGYDVVNAPRKSDIHYVFRFTTAGDNNLIGSAGIVRDTKERMKALQEMEAVESVYTIRQIDSVYFSSPEERKAQEEAAMEIILAGGEWEGPKDTITTVRFYEKEMLSDFPALKKIGIELRSEGCLLGENAIREFVRDGNITFYSTTREDASASFPVTGRLRSPYLTINMGNASSQLMDSSDFLQKGNSVLFEYNEENKDKFFATIYPHYNFMLKFRSDATEAEREAVLESLGDIYHTQCMEDIAENTKELMADKLWEELPKPLFMLLVSMVAFFSTVILTVKTKEKEMAISYLCGASRLQCGMFTVLTFIPVSLIPTIFCYGYTVLRPILEWNGILAVTENTLMGSITGGFLFLYFLVTLVVSIISVFALMAKKTPMQFLKGAEK